MNSRTPIRPDSTLAAEFWERGRCESCPVYDMHAHMGEWPAIYFPRGEAAQMVRSMDAAGVRLTCFSHHASLLAPDVGNSACIEPVRAFPGRLRAYMTINPVYPRRVERDLDSFDSLREIFVGLKFLAGYHNVPLEDERYRSALEFADARALPVLMHTWSNSPFDGPSHVRAVAGRYERVQFLLGHSFNDDWASAAAVAREHPNTYLELTSVLGRRGVLEYLVERVGSRRLLYGTDLPWFAEHQAIGSLLSADMTDEDRHNILHRNAEAILRA